MKVTRGRRSQWRVAPYAGRMVNRAVQTARNWVRTRTRTRTRGVQRSGVTTQRDVRNQYRRRRAPARVRWRARRYMRRLTAGVMKLVGTRTRVFNSSGNIGSALGQQLFTSFILYGAYGDLTSSPRGYDDINQLMADDYLIGETTGDAQGRNSGGDQKVYFDTGVFDITITNISNVFSGETEYSAAIELDVYEVVTNGRFDVDTVPPGTRGISLDQYFVARAGDQATSGPGAVTIDPTDRGVTPFDQGVQLRASGTKIMRKTKYFIPYGDCITYQIRDSKNHVLNTQKFRLDQPICTNFAKGIIVIAKVIPNNLPIEVTPSIAYGLTRKYKYKVMQSSYERGQY